MSFFSIQSLTVSYGGIRAVRGLNISLDKGETVALIGANGAGKTSTLNALLGLISHGGTINLGGDELGSLAVHERVSLGLSLVPEGRGVFGRLTVEENLLMGSYLGTDKKQELKDLGEVFDLFPRLRERRHQTGGTLSGGEQQMLAIGRALMGRPKVLLLDEPSMGLAPLMVEKIFEVIREISKSGVTTLLVEQNARLALESSQRAYVMESGEITMNDESQVLIRSPKIRTSYLGED
ncbi:MAG: ABC transporter ATP-binding protein [Betaproteobacteria bacterium]|jgi:branched-chain amino acid transport system ATP-binding protein